MTNLELPQIVFYIFAAITVLSALMVITQNNPVRCVLFLVLTFFASAVLWILQGAEFLALILILVYVGAVMTLFLFVVMMLNIDIESIKIHYRRYIPLGLIVVSLLVGLLVIAMPKHLFTPEYAAQSTKVNAPRCDNCDVAGKAPSEPTLSNTQQIGMVLYTDYIYAFEIAAILLLVAIISAVTLAHRHLARSKQQNIKNQIMTQRDDRVTLVSMKSEPVNSTYRKH